MTSETKITFALIFVAFLAVFFLLHTQASSWGTPPF